MPTLQDLRTPVTEDQALTTILGYLSDVGFNTDSWQEGSLQRYFVRMFAIVYASLTSLIAKLADYSYNETSSGDALVAFSLSHYDNTKNLASKTAGKHRLSNTGAVPFTITASQLVIGFTELDGTLRTYRNTTGGSLAAGGSLLVIVEAETAGAAWNIPNNSSLVLLTPLAGVKATNPAVFPTTTWITTQGADDESDDALKERNRTKWSTLAVETVRDAVLNIARNAAVAITRVGINDQNPRGAGTVDVYVAGALATAGPTDVAAAQAALSARFFGTNTVLAYAAPTVNVDLVGIVYFDSKFAPLDVQVAVENALTAYLSTVPLGGNDFSPGPNHIIAKNDIEAVIKGALSNSQSVVKTVVLSTPAADIPVPSFALAIRGSWTITYTAVSGS